MDALKNLANSITNRDEKAAPRVVPVQDQESFSLKNPFSSIANDIQNAAQSGIQKIRQTMENAKADVTQSFNQLDDKVKSVIKQYSDQINRWARQKVIESIIMVLEKFRPKIKESLKDPDMCHCVKTMLDDSVDAIWPELVDEVKYQLMLKLQEPYVEVKEKKTLACVYPLVWIRNWYLYSTQPYDRSIWKQYKTISYWFWYLASAIPYYGVSQYFYCWDFLMIDKEDEYQLVSFILSFKTMFFVTQGVMKALIGYFMLYACTTMNYTNSTYQDDCTRKGPGASIEVFSEVIGQFLQVLLIWVSFFLIWCSKQKGKPTFQYDDTPKIPPTCFGKGGRLKYFMLWDLFALGASIGLFWLVYLLEDLRPEFDNSGDFVYFSEICYGLLSFPFLLFNIPFVKGRLTKAKPTAYDRKGNCLPDQGGVQQRQSVNNEQELNILLNTLSIDISEVFDG